MPTFLNRALADQLQLFNPNSTEDCNSLRGLAADYLRSHPEEFCPFLGLELGDAEFETYCDNVASLTKAEWGGQLEIKALSAVLQRPILVYSANAPVLRMDDSGGQGDSTPLSVTYHKHYYTLGEHYNSVMPVS